MNQWVEKTRLPNSNRLLRDRISQGEPGKNLVTIKVIVYWMF